MYARPPFVLSHGKGPYVWDTDGRKYLDFSAGIAVNALGHADQGVQEVCPRFRSSSSSLFTSGGEYFYGILNRISTLTNIGLIHRR